MFSLRQLPGRRRSWLLLLFAALALVLPLRLLGITTHAELWFSVTFALCLFILPGAVLITALQGRLPVCIPHFISYGFATSLVMISIIGLLARSLHWTIDGIKALWLGLLLGAVLHLARRARGRRIIGAKPSTEAVFLVLCMLMATSMLAFSGMHHQPRNGDQHEYHAQVNRFEGGGPLDWQEIFYDTGGSPSPRFHLTYWTLAQSLLTSFSAQHILNADFVINNLLMIVALCAAFTFARNMGASSRNACLVAMLQLLCYAFLLGGIRQPGGQFYSRLLEDKLVAGFVVAPLAISAAQRAFRQRTRGALFDFALTFAATLFAHVLIAGFVLAVIVLGFAPRILLATGGKRRRSLAILILALADGGSGANGRHGRDAGNGLDFGPVGGVEIYHACAVDPALWLSSLLPSRLCLEQAARPCAPSARAPAHRGGGGCGCRDHHGAGILSVWPARR
ncbi:MAG: hypothetical protein OXE46_12680 [Chloroflexi bacterium]|nr:hypothetical protein [Chloroflexota bacterium]